MLNMPMLLHDTDDVLLERLTYHSIQVTLSREVGLRQRERAVPL